MVRRVLFGACGLMIASSANAQTSVGQITADYIKTLNLQDQADALQLAGACAPELAAFQSKLVPPAGSNTPTSSMADSHQMSLLWEVFTSKVDVRKQVIDYGRDGVEGWASGRYNTTNSAASTLPFSYYRICIGEARLQQLSGNRNVSVRSATAAEQQRQDSARQLGQPTADALNEQTASAPESIPAVPTSPAPAAKPAPASGSTYGEGAFGPRAKAALDSVLAPGAPKAKPQAPKLDYSALETGGPMSEQSKQDDKTARGAFDKAKQRRLHNRENDATDCIKMQATGVRHEWGIEGRFRLVNTCSYAVETSWCANVDECSRGRGNLWKIWPGGGWPIYFADPDKPYILVGGCRADADAKPLPSDAAISAAGGVNESHKQPQLYPGLGVLPNHRCD